ncbi:MAG: FkbM family methyltransferase [Acidobacteria bacterium]|nr:FkbM family methyltransferase [Acidobacteriota bacterium]
MRLLKLGVYHPTYLRQFYAARPALAAAPYAAQHAALIHDCYGSSDFWTSALSQLGYETRDTVANAEPLQRRWAREQGFGHADDDWLFGIAAAQVKAFRPDALLVADYSTFDAAFIRRLREECPSIRLVLGWCGAPYRDASVFGAWDVVLSCVPELIAQFRAQGHRSHHVDHAFEPRILERIDTASPPATDFTFIGSVLKQDQFHVGREKILARLIEETDLQIWSDIKRPTGRERRGVRARQLAHDAVSAARAAGVPESLLGAAPLLGRAARWGSRPAHANEVDARIARRARPPLFGLAMFGQLRDSRATLNTHIDRSSAARYLSTDAADHRDRKRGRAVPARGAARALRGAARGGGGGGPRVSNHARSIARRVRRALGRPRRLPASYAEVERAEQIFYLEYLREGMTVFDAGAHVGELTLLFSRFAGTSGHVHAFEAGAEAFRRLEAICRAAGRRANVTLNHLALAEEEGVLRLHVYDEAHLAWSSRAARPLENYGIDVKPVGTEEVAATTVDDYCGRRGIGRIDLLKIDVEGAELQVMLGARRMLGAGRVGCVTFEFGQTTFDAGNRPEQIEDYLNGLGYRIGNVVSGDAVFPGRAGVGTAGFSMHFATPVREP